jgi:hypothetical protein
VQSVVRPMTGLAMRRAQPVLTSQITLLISTLFAHPPWDPTAVPEAQAPRRCPIDVFRYHDYRAFLADYYQARKRRKGFFPTP